MITLLLLSNRLWNNYFVERAQIFVVVVFKHTAMTRNFLLLFYSKLPPYFKIILQLSYNIFNGGKKRQHFTGFEYNEK